MQGFQPLKDVGAQLMQTVSKAPLLPWTIPCLNASGLPFFMEQLTVRHWMQTSVFSCGADCLSLVVPLLTTPSVVSTFVRLESLAMERRVLPPAE